MTDLKFGLIGYPLGHSFSPKIHQALFDLQHIAATYELLPVKQCDKTFIQQLKKSGYHGLNVTIPHKQAVFTFASTCSTATSQIGAINTLSLLPSGELIGDNTDFTGFYQDLQGFCPTLSQQTVLVLGAGGSARAVVFALITAGIKHLTVVARSRAAQAELIASFKTVTPTLNKVSLQGTTFDQLTSLQPYGLIINTTPVGMAHDVTACPLSEALLQTVQAGTYAYDLIYNPRETVFLKQMATRGAFTRHGFGMLFWQAVHAQKIWFKHLDLNYTDEQAHLEQLLFSLCLTD